jgi:hypothetical protein
MEVVMRRFVSALVAVIVFSACQPANTEMTDNQKGEIAAEVELLHGQMWDAWRAADVDRGMSYFYNSPTLTVAAEGQLTTGFDTLHDIVHPSHANTASQTITFSESQTTVLAQDIVYIMEQSMSAATDTLGVTGLESAFANTFIWVRQDGEWKIHFAHQSSPNAETP